MEDYLESYISNLNEVKKMSKNTVAAYKRDLKKFFKYLVKENIKTEEVNNEDIEKYIKYMKNQGFKASSATRTIATLRSFYTYLLKSGKISSNPCVDIKSPKVDKKLPIVLTPEEITLLLDQPNTNEIKGIRDRAMLEFAYATGMRASEIVNLNISDIDLEKAVVVCDDDSAFKRIIPMGKMAVKAISDYIKNAREYIEKEDGEEALFLNLSGKRLTRQGLWKIIKTYTNEAKIDKEITPHVLRHSFAMHLVENGADLKAISAMLGHSDISSTKIYLELKDQRLKDIYNNSHPRA